MFWIQKKNKLWRVAVERTSKNLTTLWCSHWNRELFCIVKKDFHPNKVFLIVADLWCFVSTQDGFDSFPKRSTSLPECDPIINWSNTSACPGDVALNVHNLCVPPWSFDCSNPFIRWDDPVEKTKNICHHQKTRILSEKCSVFSPSIRNNIQR